MTILSDGSRISRIPVVEMEWHVTREKREACNVDFFYIIFLEALLSPGIL